MSFDLAARLAARRAENLYRQRPLLESPQGPQVVVDGQPLLAFCNNDYLGLANHPQVIEAWRAGASKWGVGGGASHLVIGHSSPHHALEEALADLTGRPRALLFTTGYMANLGAVTALVGPGDTVLEDRLNQVDLRFSKIFRFGRTRVQGNFDIYNALNGSAILTLNTRYGPTWLQPTAILGGRLFEFSAQLDF